MRFVTTFLINAIGQITIAKTYSVFANENIKFVDNATMTDSDKRQSEFFKNKIGSMIRAVEAEKIKAIRHEFPAFFEALSKLLFEADPIGINFETNTDEYEPEVGTIIPRLKQAQSEGDMRRIIHEEFCKWFDVETAGPIEAYGGIASKAWVEWQ